MEWFTEETDFMAGGIPKRSEVDALILDKTKHVHIEEFDGDSESFLTYLVETLTEIEEEIDYTQPEYWPTSGGMDETEGAVVADHYSYDLINSTKLICEDRSHSPNGKVYNSGGIYIGADNTGHVGWSLKVWTKKKGNTLLYRGNFIWDGKSWSHNNRCTKGGSLSFP